MKRSAQYVVRKMLQRSCISTSQTRLTPRLRNHTRRHRRECPLRAGQHALHDFSWTRSSHFRQSLAFFEPSDPLALAIMKNFRCAWCTREHALTASLSFTAPTSFPKEYEACQDCSLSLLSYPIRFTDHVGTVCPIRGRAGVSAVYLTCLFY